MVKRNLRSGIKQDLLDQLERNGTTGKYYTDLVDDYMIAWDTKNQLAKDIASRGAVVDYISNTGQANKRKNVQSYCRDCKKRKYPAYWDKIGKKRRNHSGQITPEWYLWYGMNIGLSREETLSIPFSQLLDLIAIEQIKHEGATAKLSEQEEDAEVFRLLNFKIKSPENWGYRLSFWLAIFAPHGIKRDNPLFAEFSDVDAVFQFPIRNRFAEGAFI